MTTRIDQPENSDASEVIEVTINEVASDVSASATWLVEGLRRMLLASIGAIAMRLDEAEPLIDKLVERGELAQKDGQKLLNSLQSKVQSNRAQVSSEQVGARLEQGLEEVLSRLNIPSKRDIEELTAKIAQLTARVEELKKNS